MLTSRLVPLLVLSLLAACDKVKQGSDPDDDEEAVVVECTADRVGQSRACDDGLEFCASDLADRPTYFWGPCVDAVCEPGDIEGCLECILGADGVPAWVDQCGPGEGATSTPLVLRFTGAPVLLTSSSASFELGPQCAATDWPGPETPWLVLDRDLSGGIEGGHELFGSATVLRSGALAEHGFVALAELDDDADGRLTPADAAFTRLSLWSDHDRDRQATAWELLPLAAAGVDALDLAYRSRRACDARGNCEIERAAFRYHDGLGRAHTGELVDIHLACQ